LIGFRPSVRNPTWIRNAAIGRQHRLAIRMKVDEFQTFVPIVERQSTSKWLTWSLWSTTSVSSLIHYSNLPSMNFRWVAPALGERHNWIILSFNPVERWSQVQHPGLRTEPAQLLGKKHKRGNQLHGHVEELHSLHGNLWLRSKKNHKHFNK